MKNALGSPLWRALSVGLAIAIAGTGTAHAAEPLTAATPMASVSVAVAPLTFDGADCASIPVTVTYLRAPAQRDDVDLILSLDLRQPGSNTSYAIYPRVMVKGDAPGEITDALQVCPSTHGDDAGDYVLSGDLFTYSMGDGSTSKVDLDPRSLPVTKNPTRITSLRLTTSANGRVAVVGAATAATATRGDVGAASTVTISSRKPKSKGWKTIASLDTDNFGRWRADLGPQARGTQIRVTLTGCRWCTDATRVVTVR